MNLQDAAKAAGITTSQSFFDGDGHLKLELVSKAGVEPKIKEMARDRPTLSRSQLRRFFNYCRKIERRLKSGQSDWGTERANVAKLSCHAADAVGKHRPKIPPSFHRFIESNVSMVKTERDFLDGFMQHFEALVGFAALHLPKEER